MKAKRMNKKQLTLLISLILIITVAAGGTLAYLVAKTSPVTNTFTPAEVTCQVNETFDNKVKKDVSVENTGDTDAFIRAALVITWKDAAGNVAPQTPVANTDYTISLNTRESDKWIAGTDGYYYYKNSVAPGHNTDVLINSCEPEGAGLSGYTLHVEIIADAVQSELATAVMSAWPVSVQDGVLSFGTGAASE